MSEDSAPAPVDGLGGTKLRGEARLLVRIDGREVHGALFRDPGGRLRALVDEWPVD